ncbi:MAG TPA: right-handed parallel beta-helix repeat-containing protein [Solirubrobacterales bacterium]|nr:right-handed parallel beta-helix repeat-containing protein [Solirubrobacterales bacterium]
MAGAFMNRGSFGLPSQRSWSSLAILAVVATAFLTGMFVPAAVHAAEFTVNSTGDQSDETVGSGGCRTTAATCTLRAAIEESNASVSTTDEIRFSFASFDGEIADTIEIGSSLPTITDSVEVGGLPFVPCETDYFGLPGPCVGINGPDSGPAFRIAAEEVVLNNLAISGAETAVEAVGALGMRLYNNWIGLKLDGSAGPVEIGVFLDQESDGATIGGVGSNTRNIFAHSISAGIRMDGADSAVIRGNGFGVMPDGATLAANGTNIKITDAATGDDRVASGNWIGQTLEDEALASPTCDGGCNVIAGANGPGIDLAGNGAGEEPATGTTRIFGNYIGLNAFGTASIPNGPQGVLIGSADNVTIGGPRPGDRNLISGGDAALLAGPNAGNLDVEGNWIGLAATGKSTLEPPTATGIAVEGGYQVTITENRISMATGTAIEAGQGEPVIRANAIGKGVGGEDLPGGSIGVHLTKECFRCTLGSGNTIANASQNGVLIEGSRNRVYGNSIEGSGEAGICIKDPDVFPVVSRNVIGGDTAAEENAISDSGGAAIEITLGAKFNLNTRNEVARNHGQLNDGPFIDLVGGANGGIAPPVFASSTQAGASGKGALPGATIRVFRKATDSPGEIESFLAEGTADDAGNWEVAYSVPLPPGTAVAATQTRLIVGTATPEPPDGTSEFVFATTAAAESEPPPADGDRSGGGRSVAAPDTTPPWTTILKRPSRTSTARTAKFRFGSNEPEARFLCKLDGMQAKACSSPATYRKLTPGWHRFKVWAIDAAGNRAKRPAEWKFRVIRERENPAFAGLS